MIPPATTHEPATPALGPAVGSGHQAARALRPVGILALTASAVTAFQVGFLRAPLSWLAIVWLGSLFALRRAPSRRWAFYTGLVIGLGMYGPQLGFFWSIFGPAAVTLWLVLAFWLGLFLLLLHGVDRYWGSSWALALAPVLWLGLEYFRSELYYLRFSWFTAGSVADPGPAAPLLRWLGGYGLGASLMGIAALGTRAIEMRRDDAQSGSRWPASGLAVAAVLLIGVGVASVLLNSGRPAPAAGDPRVRVAGIQLEFPRQNEVREALEHAFESEPAAIEAKPQVYVLSEYTFDGPVPDDLRAWCHERRRWLIAGGKEGLEGDRFYNTAYVVGTNGEVMFQQAKSVPIQFFNDGVPAPAQRLWDSPWGRLGLCICYDLSYTRVVDGLIRQGAQALIVPAMDTVAWGEHQHRLNARMTPIRAAEYGLPIFRVASSGISQLADASGRVTRQLSFPGQGEILSGDLGWNDRWAPGLPLDRYLAPLAVLATALVAALLAWQRLRVLRRPPATSAS